MQTRAVPRAAPIKPISPSSPEKALWFPTSALHFGCPKLGDKTWSRIKPPSSPEVLDLASSPPFPTACGFFCRDSNPARPIDPAGPKMASLGYFRKRTPFPLFHPDLSDIAAAQPALKVQGYSYLANNPSCSYMLERVVDAFSA